MIENERHFWNDVKPAEFMTRSERRSNSEKRRHTSRKKSETAADLSSENIQDLLKDLEEMGNKIEQMKSLLKGEPKRVQELKGIGYKFGPASGHGPTGI